MLEENVCYACLLLMCKDHKKCLYNIINYSLIDVSVCTEGLLIFFFGTIAGRAG